MQGVCKIDQVNARDGSNFLKNAHCNHQSEPLTYLQSRLCQCQRTGGKNMMLKARIFWHLEDPIKELVVTDIELSSNDPGELYLQIIILAENSQKNTKSFPK